MAQIMVLHYFFDSGVPARRRATHNLVSTFSRAATFPRTHPFQGLQRYQALAPAGAAQGKILSFLYCPGGTPSQ